MSLKACFHNARSWDWQDKQPAKWLALSCRCPQFLKLRGVLVLAGRGLLFDDLLAWVNSFLLLTLFFFVSILRDKLHNLCGKLRQLSAIAKWLNITLRTIISQLN